MSDSMNEVRELLARQNTLLEQLLESSLNVVRNGLRERCSREGAGLARQYYSGQYRLESVIRERAHRAARDTYDFIDGHMRHAVYEIDQFKVLNARKEDIDRLGGHVVDLGVYSGSSTRKLAAIFPTKIIHGFDSFEGLPEDWSHVMAGAFGELLGKLPNMPENVKLYKGWFADTLGPWAERECPHAISLLRVDCDIYSSTATVFSELGRFLKAGSWILFDELIGYYGWQDHEYKAFMEFAKLRNLRFDYIAYGLTYTIVRVSGID